MAIWKVHMVYEIKKMGKVQARETLVCACGARGPDRAILGQYLPCTVQFLVKMFVVSYCDIRAEVGSQ